MIRVVILSISTICNKLGNWVNYKINYLPKDGRGAPVRAVPPPAAGFQLVAVDDESLRLVSRQANDIGFGSDRKMPSPA